MKFLQIVVLSLGLSLAGQSAETRMASNSFAEIAAQIQTSLADKKTAQATLIVFDLDDTLLSTRQHLGSETWYTQQESWVFAKPGTTPSALPSVASDLTQLLDIQNRLLGMIRFYPTEPEIPGLVKKMQEAGATAIICTSRGFSELNSTLRELRLNGIDFSTSRLAQKFAQYQPQLPYDLKNLAKSGLSTAEATEWKLGTPRPVSFAEGVLLTEGQHKGAMLRVLLHRTGTSSIKKLHFVDNRPKHLDRVQAAFAKSPVSAFTYHYSRVDPEKATGFDMKQAEGDWKVVKPFLE